MGSGGVRLGKSASSPPVPPSPSSKHAVSIIILVSGPRMATNGTTASAVATDPPSLRLLAAARPFLRGEHGKVDPELPRLLSVLCAAGAGECYHKHGTFLAHLLDVYRILRLWGAPDAVARCGLFHSSYSNSYVDLAIFHPDTGRDAVRAIIGEPAERLVHLFCVVPRHEVIHNDLLFHYTDQELTQHLAASEQELLSVSAAAAGCGGGKNNNSNSNKQPISAWRLKLRSLVPVDGVVAKHIRTGEPVALSRRVLAVFILMTVADFSDQYTDYQDKLFENEDARLEFRGDNWRALWPGTGKPGLWVSAMSRMAAVYSLIARDDKLLVLDQAAAAASSSDDKLVGDLVIPPVFDRCTRVLDPEEQKAARDLYWEAICSDGSKGKDVEGLLRESIAKNPFVGEPHLVLAQVLLNDDAEGGRYDEAVAAAERGLRLLLEWGSSWDKRMSWEGWVSWGRVMRDKATEGKWPRSKWGIINLGLVESVLNNT